MTSVPKPLKFLRPHFIDLQGLYENWPVSEDKVIHIFLSMFPLLSVRTEPLRYHFECARYDVLRYTTSRDFTILSTLFTNVKRRIRSKFMGTRIHSSSRCWAGPWILITTGSSRRYRGTSLTGHGLREVLTQSPRRTRRRWFVGVFGMHWTHHRARRWECVCACVCIHDQVRVVAFTTFKGYWLRSISCVSLLIPPDDISFLKTAHEIYLKQKKFPDALALAIRLGERDLIVQDYNAPGNPLVFQLLFII